MTIEDVSRDEWERYEAPVLLYDIARIRANISELAAACAGNPGHMLFAVKSFPAARILVMAYEIGMGFEVSAEQEYQMLPSDLSGRIVSLNSPFPLSSDRFLWAGNLLQNQQNSLAEAKRYKASDRCHPGLRLNHQTLPIDPTLICIQERPSRFGITWQSFLESAPLFREGVVSGVHLHNGSEQNSAGFYLAALRTILEAAAQFRIPLDYVNLGGGYHSIPQPELVQLLTELHRIAGDVPLFIEPGHILCRDAGFLLCQVRSIRDLGGERYFVNLDASYDCHTRWSYPSWTNLANCAITKMPYQRIPDPEPGYILLILTGATCHEKDQLGVFRMVRDGTTLPIKPNDPILLSNINGYSFAWNTEFNGVPKAKVRFF
jgi:diaminopimelate decarboxylase